MSDAELASPREGADQVLPSEQSEQGGIAALTEIELTTEGLRSLALKCQEWPEAAKEIQVLGEHLRDGAKGIKGLRADNNVRDDGLLEVLKTIDGKQFDLVMTVAKGSHCCRDLIQAVLDAEAKIDSLLGPRGGVNNTKFSPDMIRFERKQLEAKIEDIVKVEQVLEKLCDSSEQKKALRTLQDASDQLLSSNILSEVKTYLEERKQIAEQLKEVEMDRGRQDAQLRLKKAELEMMEEQLRQREEAAKEIQSDLGSKKAALETMTRQVLMSKEDLVHRCQARKMEAEKEIEQMRAKQQEAEKRSQGPIEECEQKTLELQKQLMNLDSHNINHIIIAVDKSSSMKCGQRWKRAVQAVDAMRKALVAAGSIDKVSVVCFDSQAFRLASSVPVTFDFVPKLQATAPSGSTEFLHAWQCISDCAMDDPKFARVFVIFVTDGLSAIGQAAAKARQLLQRLGAQKRSMCAFFVHIVERSSGNTEVAKVQSALKPLVQAANGGQTRLACMDQKVELLQVVHAEELLSAFERLADLVGIEKSVLQARIALLQKMEKERRAKQREELQHLRDYYKDMVASLCETVRAAEKASASDTDHMKELYSKLEAETRNDLTQLEGRLQNAMNAAHEGKQQLVRCKAEYESLQQNFESGKSLHERESSNLKKMSATHAEKLTSLVEKQTNLVQSYGSTTSKQLLEQVEALERMKKHFWQNCLMEQETCTAWCGMLPGRRAC
ncbi:unnamed protein product [Effrenium voratum]|nr:unnamed protein product [Effrenium voratum]